MTQGSVAGPGAESCDAGADPGGWGWQWSIEQEMEHYKRLPGKIPSLTCIRQFLRLFSPVPSDSLRGSTKSPQKSGSKLPVPTCWQDFPLVPATSEGVGAVGPRSSGKHRTLTGEA